MSWSTSKSGTKQELKAAVNEYVRKYSGDGFADSINAQIDATPEATEGYVLTLETYGHISPEGNPYRGTTFDSARVTLSYKPEGKS